MLKSSRDGIAALRQVSSLCSGLDCRIRGIGSAFFPSPRPSSRDVDVAVVSDAEAHGEITRRLSALPGAFVQQAGRYSPATPGAVHIVLIPAEPRDATEAAFLRSAIEGVALHGADSQRRQRGEVESRQSTVRAYP